MYIAARIILGFGIPTCIVSGSSLIGELGYPKERAVLTSLFNVSYFIGKFRMYPNVCLREGRHLVLFPQFATIPRLTSRSLRV